jgi:CDP-glycerol glycerophosphotransferase (TagB/SpsB family)
MKAFPPISYLFYKYVACVLFKWIDPFVPKDEKRWAFAVHHVKSDQFTENQRAVFEHVKDDAEIEKLIFVRTAGERLNLDPARSARTRIVHVQSLRGIWEMSRCKVVFVSHSIAMDYSLRWPEKRFAVLEMDVRKRVVVNLWHATSFKKLLALTSPAVRAQTDRSAFRRKERRHYAGLVSSSDVDRYAMAAMFHPLHPDNVWLTGLPRVDYLFAPTEKLPDYLREQVERLEKLKAGRRLLTYAPTYRQTTAVSGASYYQFSDAEIEQLKALCRKHDLIFGFRMHYFRNDSSLFNMEKYVDGETIFDLGHGAFSEMAAVTRCSDFVATDYSSVFIEALCRGIPVFCFAYDYEHYDREQDGILYDFDVAFPGPVVRDFGALLGALETELAAEKGQASSDRYAVAQKFFYKYRDADNSKRVVEKVKECLRSGRDKRIEIRTG